ncbi:MAG: Flp family type IVb pilin [Vicinamibacterales bacterium]
MTALFRRFVREDDGQDLVEYAMLIALIALAVVAGVGALANAINTQYQTISTSPPLVPVP